MNRIFSLPKPDRYDKLKGWLKARRLTFLHLAKELGISARGCCKLLQNRNISPERLDQFAALGIPLSLLPTPWPKTRRPATRNKVDVIRERNGTLVIIKRTGGE